MTLSERYRNMMGRETLREEIKASVLARMERGGEAQKPVRRRSWAVMAAVITCITLLGVMTVAAATEGFGLWARTRPNEGGGVALAVTNRLRLFPTEEFSEELREKLAEAERTGTALTVYPESWQAARDYVGIPLLDNTFLDGRGMFPLEPETEGASSDHSFRIRIHPGLVYLSRPYEMDGLVAFVTTAAFTEDYDGDTIYNDQRPVWWEDRMELADGSVTFYGEEHHGLDEFFTTDEVRTETMADGTDVLFIRFSRKDMEGEFLSAEFVHDGIWYAVDLYELRYDVPGYDVAFGPCGPDTPYEDFLRKIVDGFVFE